MRCDLVLFRGGKIAVFTDCSLVCSEIIRDRTKSAFKVASGEVGCELSKRLSSLGAFHKLSSAVVRAIVPDSR